MTRGTHTRLYSHVIRGFLRHQRPATLRPRARAARQAADLRHRQGRRRQVDGRRGARGARRAPRAANRDRRALEPGAGAAAVRVQRRDSSRRCSCAPGLFTISIDPEHAMDEYLRVKVGALGHALGSSRLFQAFAMATPGMRELLSIGKVWELAQLERRTHGAASYDLVIVDAPATGHGVGLLRTPRTFADIARVGPIAHQGRAIADTIADRSFTGVVTVATPEEIPVNETLSLCESLEEAQLSVDLVVLNGLYPTRFDQREVAQLADALERSRSQLSRSALRAALAEHARAETQRQQSARLQAGVNGRLAELPYVFAEQLAPPEIDLLADALAERLGGGAA